MSARQRAGENESPSPTFVEQVRDGLKHLYDFPYLQRHPLAQAGGFSARRPGETPGQRLRRELVAAIETLAPEPDVSFRAPSARLYNLLLLRYVEGMTVQEVAHEMGLSMRQVHRDLRRGEESIAAMLWAHSPPASPPPDAVQLSSVQAEMARLDVHNQPTDVHALLQRAREAVERMAAQRGVRLELESAAESLIISTNPAIARQVLINVLSRAVGQAQAGEVRVSLTAGEEETSLTLRYGLDTASDARGINHTIAQLAERLGWSVEQEDRPDRVRVVTLHMAARCPTVLVIDDNEGLVDLLSDYLTGQACLVRSATSGQEGLWLARELLPAVVLLDVMMPEMDGWEILQRLRTNPQTANIPVVVCSVINNPDLAYSLNASLFLPKPVSRDDVLNALRRLGVV